MDEDSKARQGESGRGSLAEAFKAVGASFFGVRGRKSHQSDLSRLSPVQVILVGLFCAFLFVVALLLIVRLAVGGAA